MEENANEWKNKLYEMVNKYEDELETVKQQIDNLNIEREQQDGCIKALTNDKYELEKKINAR